jgi:hypothetical protein
MISFSERQTKKGVYYMAEDRKEQVFEPEGLEKEFIDWKRYQESRAWVNDNQKNFCQVLLSHRSLWQKLVDWGDKHPIAYAAIVTTTSLLIIGGLLLSIFLGGMPLLMLIGLLLIIPLVLPVIDMVRHKTSDAPIRDFFFALRSQYAESYLTETRQTDLKNALDSCIGFHGTIHAYGS